VTGWLTVSASGLALFELDAKFVSPLYVAVIAYEPAEGSGAAQVAIPVALVTAAEGQRMTVCPPTFEAKATVPVGVVDPEMVGITVAVKVTDSFTNEEESNDTTVVVVDAKPTG
jgi:hypothetical protein